MKKLKKILFFNTTLLLAGLLLIGCSDEKNTVSNTDTTDKKSTIETNSSTESENSHTEENYNDTLSETIKNEKFRADSVNEEDELYKDSSYKESESTVSDVKESQEDTNLNENGDQEKEKENNSSTQSKNQQIHDSATAEEKQKAVSLVKSYLRDRGELEEDENHFVEYDGMINEYIIVRYSTLLSGHSSTNGRYAVDLMKDEVKDITSIDDLDKLFN
ncbi:hypothetical protein [Metabacillus endolithicus]|uniref:Lipoprotein n=1 Tax=Metabacillus endolithicus TaxID=1535204 RepID=A0ABW5BQ92_9BACI|nr:hypothetical protein [Metabacillus endolithicus]UPG63695.1 hypothetical protein MVE64_00480 [Metabacillus endolithicus]